MLKRLLRILTGRRSHERGYVEGWDAREKLCHDGW